MSSCSSNNSPSSTKSSTGGLSEISLSASDAKLEILSLLEAFCKAGDSEPVVKAGLGRSVRGQSAEGQSATDVLVLRVDRLVGR